MTRPKKATVALIYDFDGTLSPGNMQEYGFIQAAGLDANTFWEKNTKMKVAVKRLLRRFGYPPDMQLLATETVLKQAERIAEELVKS